jgi:hypothetical protein
MTRDEFQAELAFEQTDARWAVLEAFCLGLTAGLVLGIIVWSLW